jgi:hypothetical protein
MSEWQPIETAPKDGSAVLAFWPKAYQGKGGMYVVLWFDGQFVPTTMGYRGIKFTHWMPLPAPPEPTP